MTLRVNDLDRTELGQALEHGCVVHSISSAETAAVHLLTTFGRWLHRNEVRAHVELHESAENGLTAWIDWAALAGECDRSPASSGEIALLRLACHLSGHLPARTHDDWALGSILQSLDPTNAMLACRATAMAALGKSVVRSLR